MKTLLTLLVSCSLAFGVSASGSANRPGYAAPTAATACPPGSVRAVIRGTRRCLRQGQRCARRDDRRYHRYGFHCHRARLTRARPAPGTARAHIVAAAGDIACEPGASVTATRCRHGQTAKLLENRSLDAILSLGDNQYEDGTYSEFTGPNGYAATWGTRKRITRPTPGNHEYHESGASGYFQYFGAAAGERGKGYYSFDLGSWHLIALNSEISTSAGSTQEQWLRADLRKTRRRCILAYWHRPRFSSGSHGGSSSVAAFWRALYDARADVVLNGHDHDYERFALQNPGGQGDADGIREFVVGTGGASHSSFGSTIQPNSQARDAGTYGVLQLSLRSARYDWRFVPEAGRAFTDSGSTTCH